MTIGIGWTDGFGAILACDQQQTYGQDKDFGGDKHFEVRGFHGVLAGQSSSKFFVEAVLYTCFIQGINHNGTREVCVRTFARMLRAHIEEWGWLPEVTPGKLPWWELSMLLTDGRRLFEINTNLVPREVPKGQYAAIGSGWDQAIAVCGALAPYTLPMGEIIRTAAECAIAHSLSCGGSAQTFKVLPPENLKLVWRE